MRPLVLIIDSDSDTSALLGDRLTDYGFDVIETHKPGHALLLIKNWAHTRRSFNGILLNLEPPFSDGLDTLQELVELHPEIPVIVLCSWPDADLLVEARQKGARDIIIRNARTRSNKLEVALGCGIGLSHARGRPATSPLEIRWSYPECCSRERSY